ncbi:MAG: acyl-CoA mutase large subunit family protein, partial [Gammaproteobacteria bacterium]|nr:acyl-CoA mutase large subunit family protein [Gammaproteobacteria bacterium]
MSAKAKSAQLRLPGFDSAQATWQTEYTSHMRDDPPVHNRSGIEIKPLYTPDNWDSARYMEELGFPGAAPMTRGIYPSMHRGRTWTQRQLIGYGTPKDYNRRLRKLMDTGVTAVSLIPCNSVYRGYDADEVDTELLGTCGAVVNTVDDMLACLDQIPIDRVSTAMNDPLPFTLLAFVLGAAKRRNIPWTKITGTSNQSDYISHFVANHMFLRLSLPGNRRVLVDEVGFCQQHVPNWNPVSIVGQHMQQAGATPAQAMAFALCTAIQFTSDCIERGMQPRDFLPRFTFFFDISLSFFEEIAKFRAGRRIWGRIVRERFKVDFDRAFRFKFHSQTSGADLTRQQPLNNIARVAVQAMAGIFGGTQSLHTDAYDEVLTTPTEEPSRIAINTQNILRDEAHLTDVIDPLGGSYYVETLTNQMEEEIEAVVAQIDALGGMYRAVEAGAVQRMIGEGALAFQERIESGAQKVVGVNAYRIDESAHAGPASQRPESGSMEAYLESLQTYKSSRSRSRVQAALSDLQRACNTPEKNVFEQ